MQLRTLAGTVVDAEADEKFFTLRHNKHNLSAGCFEPPPALPAIRTETATNEEADMVVAKNKRKREAMRAQNAIAGKHEQ